MRKKSVTGECDNKEIRKEYFEEYALSEIESREVNRCITEADVKILLPDFSRQIISRNIPECKKFIRDFVKEVIVYKDHIEVTFNVAFCSPSMFAEPAGCKKPASPSR